MFQIYEFSVQFIFFVRLFLQSAFLFEDFYLSKQFLFLLSVDYLLLDGFFRCGIKVSYTSHNVVPDIIEIQTLERDNSLFVVLHFFVACLTRGGHGV